MGARTVPVPSKPLNADTTDAAPTGVVATTPPLDPLARAGRTRRPPPRRRWTRWRALVERVGHLHAEIERLVALARGDAEPDLAVVRASWQMFISPAIWSWRPFAGLWRWDALPLPLRYAIHAALAIAAGQTISLALPWGTHDYWIRSEPLAAAAPGPGSRHRAALAR